MKKMRSLFLCLLALMIPAINAPAFADRLYSPDLEFTYTPGEDCILEDGYLKITLNGKQPARVYPDGYDLGLTIENHTDQSIELIFGYDLNVEVEDYNPVDFDAPTLGGGVRFQIPGNCTQVCYVPIVPDAFAFREDGKQIDPAAIEKIRHFEGIDIMDFTTDQNYVVPQNMDGTYVRIITISQYRLLHFQH